MSACGGERPAAGLRSRRAQRGATKEAVGSASRAIARETPWARLPAELAPALRLRLDETARSVAATVTASIPAFADVDDPKFERDVHAGVRLALERFVELVGTTDAALPAPVRESFVALGAAEAREGRGTETLLAAVRLAARLLLRGAAEALADVRPVRADELLDLSDAVASYTDELAAAATEGYSLQLREQAGEADRRRRLLAELLLRGDAAESAVTAAATAVGWRRLAALVPVLLPPEQARDARFRYADEAVVVERERDCVLFLRDGPRATRDRLAAALHGRGGVVGPPLPWSRMPEAVRLAELARELTRPSRGEAVFAVDHLATLALRGEAGALDVLAERRLAPLAALPDPTRERLLETLHGWLRHWGSRADVAAELYVHPQTVSYRLNQLRALLGDVLDDPAARFELLLVLNRRRGLGPRRQDEDGEGDGEGDGDGGTGSA